ncbi:MAG: NAD(P)/FAD-dependent oxidoreductase [Pseudonocardiaceae bacterium]|nr:NAD(P)/FAD-dependent oxidoreductase [Pseudonocardiaceae bacterium]
MIIGYGMAGARLADEIRRRDRDAERVELTVLGEEPHRAYNRVLLSSVLAGSLRTDAVTLHRADWAAGHSVDLRLDTSVHRIDRERREVLLDGGEAVGYDALVLATGSRPLIPPTDGLLAEDGTPAPGVLTFRTLDDCERILAGLRPGAPVAVLGGGLLGLEAARGLAGRGSRVTVVHPVGHLMERQLDPAGGGVLARRLGELGIEFKLNTKAMRYLPGDGLKLDDGGHVPAELVVVSAGVRPETALASTAGIDVDGGIVVDTALRTSDSRVHAIGDCARFPGTPAGLVQPAWEQAAVLADLLTGTDVSARYRGTPVVTRLKARDVDVASLGEVHTAADDPEAEVLCLTDPTRGHYVKLVIRDERVAGAIVLGAPDAAASVTQFYDRGMPVPADRLALLLGRSLPMASASASPADLPASAVICRCNSVSKGQLVNAWLQGARGVSGLAEATRASTGCGGCRDVVDGLASWLVNTA